MPGSGFYTSYKTLPAWATSRLLRWPYKWWKDGCTLSLPLSLLFLDYYSGTIKSKKARIWTKLHLLVCLYWSIPSISVDYYGQCCAEFHHFPAQTHSLLSLGLKVIICQKVLNHLQTQLMGCARNSHASWVTAQTWRHSHFHFLSFKNHILTSFKIRQ